MRQTITAAMQACLKRAAATTSSRPSSSSRSLSSLRFSPSPFSASTISASSSSSSSYALLARQGQALRYASSAKGTTSDQNAENIPAHEQPSTSPDQSAEPLEHPVGTEGTSSSSRDAATVHQEAEEAADESHTLMSEQEKEILHKLQKNFPSSTVAVQDVSGGCGTFFAISVESDKFKGLSKIKQHQLVNKVLEEEVKTWHGMQLKTQALQA